MRFRRGCDILWSLISVSWELEVENVLEFITSGKDAASRSHVTTPVSNARCGFVLVFVAGGHFRTNCLTIG
jgi:hypothetical protein